MLVESFCGSTKLYRQILENQISTCVEFGILKELLASIDKVALLSNFFPVGVLEAFEVFVLGVNQMAWKKFVDFLSF